MDRWTLLQTCAAQFWTPHWGDLDRLGLALTVLYATAALMTCIRAAQVWRRGSRTSSRWFWTFAALYLIVLTLNKQLDLQTLITETGRCVARAQGWYWARRSVQEEAAIAIIGTMALGSLMLILKARRGNGLMIAGLCLLTTFIALRIVSLHHIDAWLRKPLFGLGLARIIELSSLLLINLAAAIKRPTA